MIVAVKKAKTAKELADALTPITDLTPQELNFLKGLMELSYTKEYGCGLTEQEAGFASEIFRTWERQPSLVRLAGVLLGQRMINAIVLERMNLRH